MKNLLYLLCFTLTTFLQAQNAPNSCYELIWSDEFNGNQLDRSKWDYDIGDGCPDLCGWGNNELQYYTDRTENVRVENGMLVIEARPENYGGRAVTSGKIQSRNHFAHTYGRFEARIRMPLGAGHWPAFWMLRHDNNWPMTGEIDIMEYNGSIPTKTSGAVHYGSPWPNNQYDDEVYYHSASLADDFHVYAVEWDANSITWFFDDVEFKKITLDPYTLNPASTNDPWPWNDDFWIIINNAVGGWFTGVTDPNNVEYTKGTLEVDYVRVYSMEPRTDHEPFLAQAHSIPGVVQAEEFDKGCNEVAYFDVDNENQGGAFRNDGVGIEEKTNGGYNIGWLEAGEWLAYSVNVQTEGTYSIAFDVAGQQQGNVYLDLDGQRLTEDLDIMPTGDWQNWQTQNVDDVYLSAGNHTLYLRINQGGFNLDKMEFTLNTVTNTTQLAENTRAKVYPNPFTQNLQVELNSPNAQEIVLRDLNGKAIKRWNSDLSNTFTLSMPNNLVPSVYLLEIQYANKVERIKIFKNQ